MSKEHIATAETVDAAVELALVELSVGADAVEIEVLEEPGKKLFGGKKDAVVRVRVREEEVPAAVVMEAKQLAEELIGLEESTKTHQSSAVIDEVNLDDLSDDEVDAIADAGIANLRKLIGFLSNAEIQIEEFEGDEGEIILDVSGEDVGILIGRHGRTIDALQVAVSAITTKQMGVRYPLSVDIEGYKYRRKQKVIDIARRAADRAKRTGRSVSLKSMPPHERRIVHVALRETPGITTNSEGSAAYRHIVIVPV